MKFNIDAPDFEGKTFEDSKNWEHLTELMTQWSKKVAHTVTTRVSAEWEVKIYEDGTYNDVITLMIISPKGQDDSWVENKIKTFFQYKRITIKDKHEAFLGVKVVGPNHFELELIPESIKEI